MDRQIPLNFDSMIIDSPVQEISTANPNIYRLKVRVFTKYANRNGSYITEEVANQLIESATNGLTPVVGFFDPETKTWASHTGPTLANAYGYVEDFLGWEPFLDTDGVTREYAVFSVMLFTEYYEEAKNIINQNQSMELNPKSITGDWAEIQGEYYYVYTTAKMMGFCVIGSHEPCFSVSAFFSKDEQTRNEQLSQISSLLFDLKKQVEGMDKKEQGGIQPMDEFENNQPAPEEEVKEPKEEEKPAEFEEQVEETHSEEEEKQEEKVASDFEVLQNSFNELTEAFNDLKTKYEEAMTTISQYKEASEKAEKDFNEKYSALEAKNVELQEISNKYNAMIEQKALDEKNLLIQKYEKLIDEEEISVIREQVNDFSYDELESKLAICFANKQMAGGEEKKVPLPEPQESQFALLMKKYRKN